MSLVVAVGVAHVHEHRVRVRESRHDVFHVLDEIRVVVARFRHEDVIEGGKIESLKEVSPDSDVAARRLAFVCEIVKMVAAVGAVYDGGLVPVRLTDPVKPAVVGRAVAALCDDSAVLYHRIADKDDLFAVEHRRGLLRGRGRFNPGSRSHDAGILLRSTFRGCRRGFFGLSAGIRLGDRVGLSRRRAGSEQEQGQEQSGQSRR